MSLVISARVRSGWETTLAFGAHLLTGARGDAGALARVSTLPTLLASSIIARSDWCCVRSPFTVFGAFHDIGQNFHVPGTD